MAEARAVIEAACQPFSPVELVQELTKLRLGVVSNLRGADLEGWMAVVLEELEDFPAAVVAQAFRRWRRREKFLPSCAELVEECHQLNKRRRALRRLVDPVGSFPGLKRTRVPEARELASRGEFHRG